MHRRKQGSRSSTAEQEEQGFLHTVSRSWLLALRNVLSLHHEWNTVAIPKIRPFR
jgi:hypothetical protein